MKCQVVALFNAPFITDDEELRKFLAYDRPLHHWDLECKYPGLMHACTLALKEVNDRYRACFGPQDDQETIRNALEHVLTLHIGGRVQAQTQHDPFFESKWVNVDARNTWPMEKWADDKEGA